MAFEFKQFGSFVRDIYQAVAVVRPAIINADDQGFAVAEIGHPRIARHWQGRMGRGQRSHVENFAIGGQPAMEIIAVPGSQPFLAIGGIFFRHIHPPCNGIGLADPVSTAALRHRFAESNNAGTAGNAVFRIDPAGEFVR